MKTILLGESNPRSDLRAAALWPHPVGCSGWRLWKMLNDRTGMGSRQYIDGFDRRNIKTHPDVEFEPGSTVVVLGEKVRKHLKLPKVLIHPIVRDGVTFRQVPHPSGRTLFYNDPVCRELVAMLLEDLYDGN